MSILTLTDGGDKLERAVAERCFMDRGEDKIMIIDQKSDWSPSDDTDPGINGEAGVKHRHIWR